MDLLVILFVLYMVGNHIAKWLKEDIKPSIKDVVEDNPRDNPNFNQNIKTYCSRCGRSVSFETSLWTNRMKDKDTEEVRKSKGAKYPKGEYICGDCWDINKHSSDK